MAVFKCKMCGGELELNSSETTATCTYCNTIQTLPKLDDEKKANLYDRANHLRMNNEFDKAMAIYEQILNEDNTDAESYWSIVLCRYGIQYVEDPQTHQRIPTVNRTQFTSVVADEDYKSALEYADSQQKSIYEREAKQIDDIQRGILAISQNEEPFDVFICYKETDRDGRRTHDSVLANDLYHQLTQEGFKVFFSRITLEDKLGTAYEPYIFAALNSAKVMVAIGTKQEYFNAVWVKNEWSRYLSLMKKGEKKVLIPAYRDMDPYDLPEEFSHLQAQDMSKLGFMQDLIRGIRKIVGFETQKQQTERVAVTQSGGNIQPLLKRVFMFLEDEDWAKADEYCEKVLNIEPECAEAYLGKLMAELKVSERSKLGKCEYPFDEMNNYRKVIRFGSEEIKNEVIGYVESTKHHIEIRNLDEYYNEAKSLMQNANSEKDFIRAKSLFEQFIDYKDSREKIAECEQLLEKFISDRNEPIYNEALTLMKNADSENDFIRAKSLFEQFIDYKDSREMVQKCENRRKELIYNHCKKKLCTVQNKGELISIKKELFSIVNYLDSEDLIEQCDQMIIENEYQYILEMKKNASAEAQKPFDGTNHQQKAIDLYKKAIKEFESLPQNKATEYQINECKEAINEIAYVVANNSLKEKEYHDAANIFRMIKGYKESDKQLYTCETKIKNLQTFRSILNAILIVNIIISIIKSQSQILCKRKIVQ